MRNCSASTDRRTRTKRARYVREQQSNTTISTSFQQSTRGGQSRSEEGRRIEVDLQREFQQHPVDQRKRRKLLNQIQLTQSQPASLQFRGGVPVYVHLFLASLSNERCARVFQNLLQNHSPVYQTKAKISFLFLYLVEGQVKSTRLYQSQPILDPTMFPSGYFEVRLNL